MASLNKLMMIGNLTKDPEVRYTPANKAVVDLRLAVDDSYKDSTGKKVERAVFLDVTVWGIQAENCGKYLKKGSPVFIEGRLQMDAWESKEGEKRTKLKAVAERVQFLSSGRGERGGESGSNREPGPSASEAAEAGMEAKGDEETPF
jgi:single-strand DNA-binding protein